MGDFLYDEREQTKAKHDLLRRYLERFAYKILHGYGAADFIDGFSGPWENKDRTRFRDTSFGIALETLNTAAANLAEQGKPAKVRYLGVPGSTRYLQFRPINGGTWQTIATNVISANGLTEVEDQGSLSDLNGRAYRTANRP